MIYEYGKPWWNDDIDREKLLTCPPVLTVLPAEPSGSKWEELVK
jgi:hypothetical protein